MDAARTAFERTPGAVQRRRAVALLAGMFIACMSGARAEALHESVMKVQVGNWLDGGTIEVTVYKPEGAGPFPVAVLSHGSPRNAAQRKSAGRQRLAAQSEPFIALGFAVLVPTRRGYGNSGGEWAEAYGRCSDPAYYEAGLESARDIRAAVEAVRAEPWVDAKRVVLVGQSAGGFASVAASSQPMDGLLGVINFAGGRGSQTPDHVCGEARLVEAMGRYGRTARVPELWIYSTNDHFFGPPLARRMHAAFVEAGGRADFVAAPESGIDGHGYFVRGMGDWTPRVAQFVRRIGAVH